MSTGSIKGKGLLVRMKQLFRSKKHITREASANESSNDIQDVVLKINGVIAVESCIAREQGHYVVASIIINVNPKISVYEGYEIGQRVKWLLMHRFTHLSDVVVHIRPFTPEYPYKTNEIGSQVSSSSLLQ